MIHYYKIYNYTVASDTVLDLLEECESNSFDLTLSVRYGDIMSSDNVQLTYTKGVYCLTLGSYAEYTITANSIHVLASDYESMFSTLFNLPFSVLTRIYNNCLLMHCNTLQYNKSLISICGPKGIGKSTLSSILCKNGLNIYGDDTLNVINGMGYPANNLIKLYDHDGIGESFTKTKYFNVVGKRYCQYQRLSCSGLPVRMFLMLERTSGNDWSSSEIKSYIGQRVAITENLVGISVLSGMLINNILSENYIIRDCKFLRLRVPNSLEYLVESADSISTSLIEYIK